MKQFTKILLGFFTLVLLATPGFAQSTADEYFKAAHTRLQNRDLAGAIAALDKAIELKPDFSRAYLQRGRFHVMQGAVDAAIADFDKAILIDPQLADTYSERARLRQMKNNVSGALSDLDNAIVRGYRSDAVYTQRSSLRMMTGDLKGAIADADAAISLNPNRIGNYLSRGSAREAAGDIDGALSDYNYIIERFERKEAERIAAGKSERTAVPFDITSPVISGPEVPNAEEKTKDPKSLRSVTMLGGQAVMKLDMRPGMTPEQMEYLPNVAGAYSNRAHLYSKKGESAEALASFTKAIKINPFFGTYYGRARELRKTGDLDGAIADFTTAIKLRPDMGPFYFERGTTYLEMNRDEEAERDFVQALALEPRLKATIETRRGEAKQKREKTP